MTPNGYVVSGPVSRQVDMGQIRDSFGHGAVVCPAITAGNVENRVCVGCRRCWAASMKSPIIYPNS